MTAKTSPDHNPPIETAKQRELLQAREAELAVLNSIQEALLEGKNIDAIFEIAGEQVSRIFPGEGVALYTYDPETNFGSPKYILEDGIRHYPPPFKAGPIGQKAAATKKTLVINTRQEFDEIGAITVEGTRPSLSGMYAPLIVKDKPVGALNIESTSQEHAFDEADVQLVNTIARSLSIALENARLFNETQRLLEVTEARNAELAIINTVQQALASELDIQGIYDAVGEKLRMIFDSQVVAIYSADPETRILKTVYAFEKGRKLEVVSRPFSSLNDYIFEKNDTLVFNGDFPEFADQFEDYRVTQGEMPQSILIVPVPRMKDPKSVVTLTLQDVDGEKEFTDSDVRLLETLANSMGVALENARLFDETQRLLEETEQRAAELQIINSVQDGLAARSDLQAIYDLVGDTLQELFSAESMYIAIVDQPENVAHYVYFLSMGERVIDEPSTQPVGLGGHVYETRQPLILGDITLDTMREYGSYFMGPQDEDSMSRSFMGAPILSGENILGMVSILNQRKNFFTASDLRLLSTLTNSMGVALENARLFAETQRLLKETEQRAAELQIINSVQEGLASKLEMQAIYDLIGEKIQEIFDADTTFIAFHDRDQDLIFSPYYNDRGARQSSVSRKFGTGLAERVILSGEPLILDSAEEMRAVGSYAIASPGSDKDLNESFLGVPIYREGNPIGVTSVQSYKQHAYTQNDLTLLQTLTNSMSVALENARLFDETERLLKETEQRAAELATINTVSQALVAEPELDALIELIGDQMRQIFDADIVYVALLDPETGTINFPYTFGEEFEPLKLGEGLTSKVIESGEPLLINAEMDKRRKEMGVARVGRRAASYLGVPIQMGGRTFGVISVQSTSDEDIFTENDMHLLNTIAANVSAAIRNAQLFSEITRQKQYYEAVIENSPAAIVLLDLEANVTGWNPAAERLFGYTEQEALGRNVDDLVAVRDDLHAEAVSYSQQALREKQVQMLARRTRKDGSLVEVDVSGLPVSVNGEYVGFIAIYHDVTELQRARLAAEEANRAKSTFLANMSHELRTPLNAIIGFTRIVQRKGVDSLPPKQLENLDKVLVSAEHLLHLINTVLDISKIEAGRLDVHVEDFEIEPLIREVADTHQSLLKEGVQMRVGVESPVAMLHSDKEKVRQIFINLLSNAAKFTHHGQILLSARQEGECLYVDVSDTGIGIPADALDRVFDEFQQADSSTTRQYGGTGLGLSISRRLARLLGGDLTVASVEGKGSTFTMSIPLRYNDLRPQEQKQGADDDQGFPRAGTQNDGKER